MYLTVVKHNKNLRVDTESGAFLIFVCTLFFIAFINFIKYNLAYEMESEKSMWNIDKVPCIATRRLILNEITISDIPQYNDIIMDCERNRFWGYDDTAGIEGEIKNDSFYNVAKEDFKNKECVNFAIRLKKLPDNGETTIFPMIGEAVLYDFKGEQAELGLRISSRYEGHGLGMEGFYAVLNWALDTGFLKKVVAKCFKENMPSYKMLSHDMDFIGRNETFYFFKKEKGK